MVEQGHFAELDRIVGLVSRKKCVWLLDIASMCLLSVHRADENAYEDDFENEPDSLDAVPPRDDLRTSTSPHCACVLRLNGFSK